MPTAGNPLFQNLADNESVMIFKDLVLRTGTGPMLVNKHSVVFYSGLMLSSIATMLAIG